MKSVAVLDGKCVHCGACTAVCPSGALSIEAPRWELSFEKDKCDICQLCARACPVHAITVSV